MKKTKPSKPASGTEKETEMIANVRLSSESALKALKIFHRSLVVARLPDSIGSYRTMCDTLLGQKIWMLDKNDVEAKKNFEELNHIAAAIAGILEPYNTALKKLTLMDIEVDVNQGKVTSENLDEATDAGQQDVKPILTETKVKTSNDLVLGFLAKQKKYVSITKLRSETGLRKKELESTLHELMDRGMVVNKKVNGRELFEKV